MIFYFTGTGNSLYAAKALAHDGEDVISVIDAVRKREFHYELKENEALGFVFPVYLYTVYAVIPCGAGIGPAGGFLKSELKKRGLTLQRVDALVVPDAALIFYDIDPPEEMEKRLEASQKELASIKRAIDMRIGSRITGSAVAGKAGLAAYHACMSTRKFHADDRCIHCGKCAAICPSGAIGMKDGRPVWTKTKCLKCCGCINRCPVSAIQYGKKTSSRCRYVNPVLR